MKEKTLIAVSIAATGVLVAGVFLWHSGEPEKIPERALRSAIAPLPKPKDKPALGLPGSTHEHVSFLMVINDEPFDFAQGKYMLRDEHMHFENGDGLTIHKHSTGVTLPLFLSTLGIRVDPLCLRLDTGERYCREGASRVRFIVNAQEVADFDYYELKDGDRILLNYGDDDDLRLRRKMNGVPPVASPFAKPF